jgi:Fibronectin type III domain
VADRKISISWVDQSDNEDGFRIKFQGQKAESQDHSGTETVDSNTVRATLNLHSGYEYTIWVVAFNGSGESQGSNPVQATTPERTISVSSQGSGTTTVFTVTGAGFTPNSLVVIRITDSQLHQDIFNATASGDGSFESRHNAPCISGTEFTFTAFEDADPSGTLANPVETACP